MLRLLSDISVLYFAIHCTIFCFRSVILSVTDPLIIIEFALNFFNFYFHFLSFPKYNFATSKSCKSTNVKVNSLLLSSRILVFFIMIMMIIIGVTKGKRGSGHCPAKNAHYRRALRLPQNRPQLRLPSGTL